MRDYVTKANEGGVPDSLTATKLGAGEINSYLDELEASVERAGLTLAPADGSGEDTTQLAKSLFIHAVKAQQFQDGGSVNTYELTPISGSSGVLLPSGYDVLDGARIWFRPGASNTGPSTINIGQVSGSLLGAKAALDQFGSALAGGEIIADVPVEFVYDASANGASGGWILSANVRDAGIGNVVFQYVDASTCRLNRSGGKTLPINGAAVDVPSAGVDLDAADAASNETLYYVYAYLDGSTLTLEASATGHSADAETDVKIVTGKHQT